VKTSVLIERLKNFPQDSEVVYLWDGCMVTEVEEIQVGLKTRRVVLSGSEHNSEYLGEKTLCLYGDNPAPDMKGYSADEVPGR
jgi:hypothetical protein